MPMNTTVPPAGHRPVVIAHRGLHDYAPENTAAAVAAAWDAGLAMVEIDIRPSGDGIPVLSHDHRTGRVFTENRVVRHTRAAALAALTPRNPGLPGGTEYGIPTLAGILEAMPLGRDILVEMKSLAGIEDATVRLISDSGRMDDIIVQSFTLGLVLDIRRHLPEIRAHWLLEAGNTPFSGGIAREAAQHRLTGLSLDHRGISPGVIEASRRSGLAVYVWTVNDPGEATMLAADGVDGIITDTPRAITQRLAG